MHPEATTCASLECNNLFILNNLLILIPVANEHLDTAEERADSGHRTFPFLRGGEEQFDQAVGLVMVVLWDDGHGDAPFWMVFLEDSPNLLVHISIEPLSLHDHRRQVV